IPATPDPTSLTPNTLILPALDLTTPTFAINNNLASTRWNHIAAAALNTNPFNGLLNHDDTDDDTPNPFNGLIPLPDLL
ncbi:MAG: hypothetical protein CMJ49_04805, partial [Planctomycetaceae bacterium]|nr:hypothetical protein [Planctomycetaceae bacterium]